MDTVNKLLDNARETCSLPSDVALAEKLGVSRQLVSQWRKGLNPMSTDRIAQVAELAGSSGADWLTTISLEHARTTRERKVWKELLDRLSPAAAAVGLVVLVLSSGIANSALDSVTYIAGESRHYANWSIAALLTLVGAWLLAQSQAGVRHDRTSPVLA